VRPRDTVCGADVPRVARASPLPLQHGVWAVLLHALRSPAPCCPGTRAAAAAAEKGLRNEVPAARSQEAVAAAVGDWQQ
jgi:hypothetical protein